VRQVQEVIRTAQSVIFVGEHYVFKVLAEHALRSSAIFRELLMGVYMKQVGMKTVPRGYDGIRNPAGLLITRVPGAEPMTRLPESTRAAMADNGGLFLRWFRCLLTSVATMHLAGVIHGDLKPDNIMIQSSGAVHLIDFGAARPSPLLPKRCFSGPQHLIAPLAFTDPTAIFTRGQLSTQHDVYAVGVCAVWLLYRVAFGEETADGVFGDSLLRPALEARGEGSAGMLAFLKRTVCCDDDGMWSALRRAIRAAGSRRAEPFVERFASERSEGGPFVARVPASVEGRTPSGDPAPEGQGDFRQSRAKESGSPPAMDMGEGEGLLAGSDGALHDAGPPRPVSFDHLRWAEFVRVPRSGSPHTRRRGSLPPLLDMLRSSLARLRARSWTPRLADALGEVVSAMLHPVAADRPSGQEALCMLNDLLGAPLVDAFGAGVTLEELAPRSYCPPPHTEAASLPVALILEELRATWHCGCPRVASLACAILSRWMVTEDPRDQDVRIRVTLSVAMACLLEEVAYPQASMAHRPLRDYEMAVRKAVHRQGALGIVHAAREVYELDGLNGRSVSSWASSVELWGGCGEAFRRGLE
jgi:hypothetical protein